MRLSLRFFLLNITAFCVCLGLTWLPFDMGALALAVIALCLRFVMPFSAWLRMALGAMFVGFGCFMVAVVLGIGDLLSEYNDPEAIEAYQQKWLTVAIQMGSFVGGSVGLLS